MRRAGPSAADPLALVFAIAALTLGAACSSSPSNGPAPGGSSGASGGSTGAAGGQAGTTQTSGGRGGASMAGSGGAGGGSPVAGNGGAAGTPQPVGGGGGSGGPDASSPDVGSTADMAPAPDQALPVCNYPQWSKDKEYQPGEIVMFMDKPYIARQPTRSHDPTISTYYWAPFAGCVLPPAAKCPELDRLLPAGEATFKELFAAPFMLAIPKPEYSYTSLCKALETPSLAGFARSGNVTQDRRELAAFFANVAIETAYLTFTDEGNRSPQSRTYHGRGSLQITSQPIYAEVGQGLGLNLVGMPELASKEVIVWQTGMWYWMHHANPSVGSPQICHAAITQSDFGRTVRIIKGDCSSNATRAAQYRKNSMLLGVDPGKTTCP